MPSPYAEEPTPITQGLLEDGAKHLLLGAPIRSFCPVHILQGMQDPDVPYAHALTLVEHLASDPVTLTLIKDGDHRLSRDQDIAQLLQAIDRLSRAEACAVRRRVRLAIKITPAQDPAPANTKLSGKGL